MKKTIYLMLFLFVFGTVILDAQVRIGGDTVPNAAAVLDLNVNDDVTPTANKGALALPRVNLTSATMQLNSTEPKDGMLIYNTGTTFAAGVYVWVSGKWSNVNTAPVITVQPRSFNWKETTGEGDLKGIGGAKATLSITAAGSNLSYRWYEVPKVSGSSPVEAFGTNNASTYTPSLADLGMRSYYCVVSNGVDSVKSDVARVAVGCGALAVDGTWRTFMCYNLGATETTIDGQLAYTNNLYYSGAVANPSSYKDDPVKRDSAVYGHLYQWGRISDGHQSRIADTINNGPAPGDYTGFDNAWVSGGSEQIASTNTAYHKFIVVNDSTPPYDWNRNPTGRNIFLWRNHRYLQNDPCSNSDLTVRWRVPTQSEWGDIFKGGLAVNVPGAANANTWNWKMHGNRINGVGSTPAGYELKPDGVTTTLFLPAAGYRHSNDGKLYRPGLDGYYWSTTTYGGFSYNLYFTSSHVRPARYNGRAYGFSVRCIAET
ncbi:MAG: fibrobacter succinogenes major paralogous domain-containing protein [Dysgonamonadaceae bacterium]|nr:fibrobacter succinogenes major paralogous domain-containing protein [Dysgonamonadaceae bacterium]